MKQKNPTIQPIRVRPRDAAIRLGVSSVHMYELMATGNFTVIAPHGIGRGKSRWLMLDEVDAYAVGGPDAVKELRIKLKRAKSYEFAKAK